MHASIAIHLQVPLHLLLSRPQPKSTHPEIYSSRSSGKITSIIFSTQTCLGTAIACTEPCAHQCGLCLHPVKFIFAQANVLPTSLPRHRNRKRDTSTRRKFSLRTKETLIGQVSSGSPALGAGSDQKATAGAACFCPGVAAGTVTRVLRATDFREELLLLRQLWSHEAASATASPGLGRGQRMQAAAIPSRPPGNSCGSHLHP